MAKKDNLLENVVTAHRQLDRYIFYFEKDEQGEFSASERTKFNKEEMDEPGVYGEWSLKDLLALVIDCEGHTSAMLAGEEGEIPEWLPEPGSAWGAILEGDHIPYEMEVMTLKEVVEGFPESFDHLYASITACSESRLFEVGVYEWAEEHAAADFIRSLTIELYDWVKSLVRRWRKRRAGERLNKEVILERIRTERRRLEGNLEDVSHEDMELSGVVGEWSVKDLLAHLVEWERMFTGWYEAGLRGESPEVPAPGYAWKDMDALNEHIHQKHRERPLEEVLSDFENSYQQVYALVECIPEEEMFAKGSYDWVGEGNLVNYILANTANHYRWAKDKVRSWLKERGEI